MTLTPDDVLLETEEGLEKSYEHLRKEFRSMRTGRANPGLIENIKVEYYGSDTPLKQLANIGVPDPTQLLIKPYDASMVGKIEKAILKSDIGITPNSDGKVVRLSIPPLSEERRKKLVQLAKKAAEASKVAMRNQRRDANKQIPKIDSLPEDSQKQLKGEIQDLLKSYEGKVDELVGAKTAELMEI